MTEADNAATPEPRRIYFHVGAPKTGTTFLQNVLMANRELLTEDGVLYGFVNRREALAAVCDFRAMGWAGRRARAFTGSWQPVADKLREWPGRSAIVSHEFFAGATSERIEEGLSTLTDAPTETPLEVHVVFTARDLARQFVSDWQEQVKHHHTVTLDQFVEDLVELGRDAPHPFGRMFWGLHDVATVLRTWNEHVPAERIHLVTVPPPGGPREALWQRFCAALQLDPERYDTDIASRNRSMGVAETEFVRRMNEELEEVRGDMYDWLVRQYLAEEVLGNESQRLTLPPRFLPWVSDWSQQLVDQVHGAGYDVRGDLADLLPRPEDHEDHLSPDDVTDEQLARAGLRTSAALILRASELRREVLELTAPPPPPPPPPPPTTAQRWRRRLREAATDPGWAWQRVRERTRAFRP